MTGKGGVGKTTVALALGLAAARRGLRTILCEVAHQERVSRALGREGIGYHEAEIGENLHAISLDQQHTLEEWIGYQLPTRMLAGVVSGSRIFGHLTAAAPGIKELVTIGKIWELAQLNRKTRDARPYDYVVVDAPATGHGLGMLRAPRTFAEIARVGPIRHQADTIHEFIVDRDRTGILGVALPEEMPVTETLEYRGSLAEQMGTDLDAVVANGVYPERFGDDELNGLERHDNPAVAAALTYQRRFRQQREQLARLEQGLAGLPVLELPFLFEPDLHLEEIDRLSHVLEERLA